MVQMAMHDASLRESSIAAFVGSGETVRDEWKNVNLKVLLAVLGLAEQPITQAKTAQLLGMSPVTMSRIVSGGDYSIREEWVPVLSECLRTVDMDMVAQTIHSLSEIFSAIKNYEKISTMVPAIELYLHEKGIDYSFDADYWGTELGLVRFSTIEKKRWFFAIDDEKKKDFYAWQVNLKYPFDNSAIRQLTEQGRISKVFYDKNRFTRAIKLWAKAEQRNRSGTLRETQAGQYYSFLLIDSTRREVEEYVLYVD